MSNINEFIISVKTSRKKTGLVYCTELFNPVIRQFKLAVPDIHELDCTKIYTTSLTFSAKDLLDKIEDNAIANPTIVFNIEAFIVSNSLNFSDQLAKLLTAREPLRPLFFFFYSKKIYRRFKKHFEAKELNCQNTIEI